MTSPAIVRIGYPWWLRPFVFRNVVAITLGRRIYLAREDVGEAVLRHELVHVRQAGELGLVRFLWRYVAEYFRNRRHGMGHDQAYRAISFEAEAFTAENDQPV
jgi:predicted metal-dependent hydrolase